MATCAISEKSRASALPLRSFSKPSWCPPPSPRRPGGRASPALDAARRDRLAPTPAHRAATLGYQASCDAVRSHPSLSRAKRTRLAPSQIPEQTMRKSAVGSHLYGPVLPRADRRFGQRKPRLGRPGSDVRPVRRPKAGCGPSRRGLREDPAISPETSISPPQADESNQGTRNLGDGQAGVKPYAPHARARRVRG
jgi:hypothetical protein